MIYFVRCKLYDCKLFKFQEIILGNVIQENTNFHIEDCIVKPQDEIKTLGITIDFKLKYIVICLNFLEKPQDN